MTIEVSDKQFAALVRGESAVVGPSKRIVTLDDGPFVVNHYGPGPHPGTGTSQDVHGEGGGARGNYSTETMRLQKGYERTLDDPLYNKGYVSQEFLRSIHDIFEHIPGTARWDRIRRTLDAIDRVHGINNWMKLPLKETRAARKGGSYHIREDLPFQFMVKFSDEYGEGTETSMVHEIGHYIDHWLLGQQEPYAPAWISETAAAQYGMDYRPMLGVSNESDIILAMQSYPIQLGQSDFDVPDGEVSGAGLDLWKSITASQAYKAMKDYPSGRHNIKPPDDFFVGDRDNPTHAPGMSEVTWEISYESMKNMRRPREAFARAYAQYIALRSGDEVLTRQIDESNKFKNQAEGAPVQWDWQEFEPIARSFDRLFEKKGWLNPELVQ